tara:strand:- start:3783 stop:6104 length:2322 start_codon:yes stop_codon:yes gene_type:complete
MPLVSSTITNIVSGVSQQPAPTRLSTSCEDMKNAYPSVVSGLMKRQPSEWLATLTTTGTTPDGAGMHVINRDAFEKYIVVAGASSLDVFDTDGVAQTLTFPDGTSYLPATDPWKKLRFTTVADTTFVLNTDKIVTTETTTETRSNPYTTASVFIKRAVASTTYAVYVNGVLAAETQTNDNTQASTALEGTSAIAEELKASAITKGYTNASVIGPVLTFTVPDNADITVLDQFGGGAMQAYNYRVQSFDRLPPAEKEGRLVRIQGNLSTASEDYWVEYNDGVWVETFGWDAEEGLDATTMPHVLQRNSDGTFTFKVHTYENRTCGDIDTNADPTFVGQTINSIFIYKGRMGLLSGENLIMSEVSNFENYYRTTVVQVFESDRVDVASITGRVNNLSHATSFSDNLILFSDSRQFKVDGGETFGPATVSITPSTSFACSTFTQPVASGPNIFFVTNGANNSTFRELFVDEDLKTVDADEVSVQVPRYIPNDVRKMSVSTFDDILVCHSGNEPNALYTYKWYVVGGDKIQSAWGKWVFDSGIRILGHEFLDDYLYVVSKDSNDVVTMSRILIDPTIGDSVLLDNRITSTNITSTYNSITEKTTIVAPYGYSGELEFYVNQTDLAGYKLDVTKVNDTTYTVNEDYTSYSLEGGIPYTFEYTFSEQFVRQEGETGSSAVQDGRLQLRYFSMLYLDSAYFRTEVTPTNNQTFTHEFNARVLADSDNVTNIMPKDTGEFRFPIFAQNTNVEIKIINDKAFPCSFGSVDWEAMFYPKTQRI